MQNVVQELQGEKIDIVPWSPDPARYVSNALSPAQVSLVVVDEEKKTLLVVVPDDQLSLAIGRQGQNVRLAAALLGWRIDVKSELKYAKFSEEGFQSLMDVQGMDEKTAEALYDAGFNSAQDLAQAEVAAVLAEVESLDENRVARLIASAQKVNTAQGQDDTEDGASTGDDEQ